VRGYCVIISIEDSRSAASSNALWQLTLVDGVCPLAFLCEAVKNDKLPQSLASHLAAGLLVSPRHLFSDLLERFGMVPQVVDNAESRRSGALERRGAEHQHVPSDLVG